MNILHLFRITLAILLLFFAPLVFSQETQKVLIETNSETPTVGEPWTFTLLVNHNEAEEVTVISQPFAPSLFLDRMLKIPRRTGSRTQTAVEYRFIPNAAGSFTLESFTVNTPAGVSKTEPYVLQVRPREAEAKPYTPKVVWEGAPAQMAAGERAIFTLRIYGWNSRQPPSSFFMPEVPRDVILSPLQITAEEREGGIAVKLTLIPLKAGDFRLPGRIIQYENIRFEIPALNIRITGGN